MEGLRRLERALRWDPLVKQDREKQGEWIASEEGLGSRRSREPSGFECAAELKDRRVHVGLAPKRRSRLERAF